MIILNKTDKEILELLKDGKERTTTEISNELKKVRNYISERMLMLSNRNDIFRFSKSTPGKLGRKKIYFIYNEW